VGGAKTKKAVLSTLESIKGHTSDTAKEDTIRGQFSFVKPAKLETQPFWFRAPFFVRNRVHVPANVKALNTIERIMDKRNINLVDFYGNQ
jgi:hypothetical protein